MHLLLEFFQPLFVHPVSAKPGPCVGSLRSDLRDINVEYKIKTGQVI